MATYACCCAPRCTINGGKCDTQHQCFFCEKYMHSICGHPYPEAEDRGIRWVQYCFDCGEKQQRKKQPNQDEDEEDSDSEDDTPLNDLALPPEQRRKKRKEATEPAPPPAKRAKPRPAKKQTRKSKPNPKSNPKSKPAVRLEAPKYTELPGTDDTNWVYPVRPGYQAPMVEFMNYVQGATFTKAKIFTKTELLRLKPKHVSAFLNFKAYGMAKPSTASRPKFARASHIKNLKVKISHFMPSAQPWVNLPDGSGYGNPTKHKLVNLLVKKIEEFEAKGEGASAKDVRDMTLPEFEKELELLRRHKDPVINKRNPLMSIYQFHFINRADDVCNFYVDDPKGNDMHDFAVSQRVRWSKNVKDGRQCPDQLLLASMDHKGCIFIALAMWLEHFLALHPEATFMMTDATLKPDATKEERSAFTQAISKTYRNRLQTVVYSQEEFRSIYQGNDKRDIGLHSKRKLPSTLAKRRGAPKEHVQVRGRWVTSGNKGENRVVSAVYISPEDQYADASVASKLCLGGPIKYKVKPELAGHITTEWLAEHVVPNIAKRYNDNGLIKNLGLALLWAVLDGDNVGDLPLDSEKAAVIEVEYEAIDIENRPEQAVSKIPLHVYRIEENVHIDEVWTDEASAQQPPPQQQQPAQRTTNNTGHALASIPAVGGTGGAAVQQVLQSILIQQQQLRAQMSQLEQRLDARDQGNRAWLEDKFRRVIDNTRRFGGTIQSGLARQHPVRRSELRRVADEEAVHGQVGYNPNRRWPTLCKNINSLVSLWSEYEMGIGGRKPAKDWTAVERGNKRQKQTYYRRNCIWKIQLHLINKGHNLQAANALIRQTYGENTAITKISEAIVKDRKRYERQGGLHPNFR